MSVSKLELRPGDVLVYSTPKVLSVGQQCKIISYLEDLIKSFGIEGVKIMVLDGGAELAVIKKAGT